MKKFFVPLFLCALLPVFPQTASAVDAVTDPVGFVKISVPAGKVQAVSLPLKEVSTVSAAISSVTASTISTTNAGWSTNAFGPFNTNPFVIRFLTGTAAGRSFKIASNNQDTITITTGGADLTTLVSSNPADRFEIVSVDTLGSLFGNSGGGLLTGTNSAAVDNILIRGSFGWLTYYNDGANWLREGAGSVTQNTVALLPDQGFLIVRRAPTQLDLTVTGVVPVTELQTEIPGSKSTLIANRFPVATTLNALGLDQLSTWQKGANSQAVDNVQIRGSFGWLTYYHDGTNWLREGAGSTPQNPAIAVGASVLVVRRTAGNSILDQPLPYSLVP